MAGAEAEVSRAKGADARKDGIKGGNREIPHVYSEILYAAYELATRAAMITRMASSAMMRRYGNSEEVLSNEVLSNAVLVVSAGCVVRRVRSFRARGWKSSASDGYRRWGTADSTRIYSAFVARSRYGDEAAPL